MSSGNKNTSAKVLKRIEMVFKGTSYKFTLNPESYEQTHNNRVTLTQTKGGYYLELFGSGVDEITMSGTTGYKNGTKDPENGFIKFKELRDQIKSVYDSVTDGSTIGDENLMEFYNYTDEEYWLVMPDKFTMMRNKNTPLLYRYEMHMYVIKAIGDGSDSEETQKVGNIVGVVNYYDEAVETSLAQSTTNKTGSTNKSAASTATVKPSSDSTGKTGPEEIAVSSNGLSGPEEVVASDDYVKSTDSDASSENPIWGIIGD